MNKDSIVETSAAGHWLYGNEPESHHELTCEVKRLQRTIAALIAVGIVSELKAAVAYNLSGTEPTP